MGKRTISIWLVAIVLLGMLIGVVGGGLLGGVVAFYVTLNRAPASGTSVPALLASESAPSPSGSTTNLTVTENSAMTDAVKKAEPGVVTIVNTMQVQSGRFGRRVNTTPAVSEGSGVIIDQQGHIVTNAHVVTDAQQIDVIYADGTKVSAKLIGADSTNDIAVLQVSGPVPAVVPFGDSNALQLGQSVIAIGSPLGSYLDSVTVGVVSGLNRTVEGSGESGLIQTDAAINHGNSGGPLLNLAGQVIGINTLVVQNTNTGEVVQGLGFAIPSNTVSAIVQRILAGG